MLKKLGCMIGSLLLVFCTMFSLPTYAEEQVEPIENELGSISVLLTDTEENLPKGNVEFALVKVADVIEGRYELKEAFASSNIDLNKITTADELQDSANVLKEFVQQDDYVATTNSEGKALFSELPVAVYLMYAKNISEYEVIAPSLIAIPTWDDKDGVMLYDIEMYPKHSHLPVIQVNKVDSVTGKNIINNQFEFTSFSDKDCKEKIQSVKANTTDGTALFTVSYGTIYIKESKAPQGYLLSKEVVKVEFTEKGLFVNDKLVQPTKDYLYSIRYQNVMMPSTQTGLQQNIKPYMLLLGGSALLFIIIFAKKKKDKKETM